MCGICGEIQFGNISVDVAAVDRMARSMARRGPDGSGLVARGSVALGHRRLKIIDLSEAAQQPMVDADLGLSIAYNGAIYNYRELRDELEARGYRFFSSGDTEVILKAYHAWGADCVKRFNGMFAFAIHERDSGRVILARDRLGNDTGHLIAQLTHCRFQRGEVIKRQRDRVLRQHLGHTG